MSHWLSASLILPSFSGLNSMLQREKTFTCRKGIMILTMKHNSRCGGKGCYYQDIHFRPYLAFLFSPGLREYIFVSASCQD